MAEETVATAAPETAPPETETRDAQPQEQPASPPGKEGGAEVPPSSEEKVQASAPPKSFKLKIDGQEKEFSEADLLRIAQKGLGSEKRFDEAAKLRKEGEKLKDAYTQLLTLIPDQPEKSFVEMFAAKNGGNRQAGYQKWLELCQEVVVRDWNEKNLPEDTRRAMRAERELEETRRALKEREEREMADRLEYEEATRMKQHVDGLAQALTAAQIPVSDSALDAVVVKMLTLREAGYDPTFEEAVEFYRQDQENARKSMSKDELKKIPLAEILQLYPELSEHVSKDTLAKARALKSSPPASAKGAPSAPVLDANGMHKKKPLLMSEF